MREMAVDGRKRLVFILKEDVGGTVFIPVDVLAPIDFKRLKEMESHGGELLKVMRDFRLDNGQNALSLYKHLIQVAYKKKPKDVPILPSLETRVTSDSAILQSTSDAIAEKRGRGRPRKVAAKGE